MSSSNNEVWGKIVAFFGDIGRGALQTFVDNEVEAALHFERKIEIKRAAKVLFEAKVNEKEIEELLQNHWYVDRSQALELIRVEKTVNRPRSALIAFLRSEGYKNGYIREYVESNEVTRKLEDNPTLWKLADSPEKLMQAIEKLC